MEIITIRALVTSQLLNHATQVGVRGGGSVLGHLLGMQKVESLEASPVTKELGSG